MKFKLNTYHNMDCMEGMKDIPDNHFDIGLVDPQYGIGVNHNIGRRKGDKHSSYAPAEWDSEPPSKEYFIELQRVSKNQIIFGYNYFTEIYPIASKSWYIWDKKISPETDFAMAEMAITTFDKTIKIFYYSNTGGANDEEKIVPSQKPVPVFINVLNTYAKDGDKILVTHGGSAAELMACHEKGLDYLGFEINPDTYKKSNDRLEAFKAQTALY